MEIYETCIINKARTRYRISRIFGSRRFAGTSNISAQNCPTTTLFLHFWNKFNLFTYFLHYLCCFFLGFFSFEFCNKIGGFHGVVSYKLIYQNNCWAWEGNKRKFDKEWFFIIMEERERESERGERRSERDCCCCLLLLEIAGYHQSSSSPYLLIVLQKLLSFFLFLWVLVIFLGFWRGEIL